jgi:hypothetical protein
MNQPEEVTEPASLVVNVSTEELGRLKWLVSRYEIVVGVFAHSLTDEFLPSEEALKDWTNSLSLLREASFPISDFLHKNAGILDAEIHYMHFQRIDRLIRTAIRILIDRELGDEVVNGKLSEAIAFPISAADLLCQANLKLRGAISNLKCWLAEFESIEASRPKSVEFSDSRKAVVLRLLDRHEQRLRGYIESKDKSDELVHSQCMTSRKLFLLSHYAASIFPDAWTRERFDRLRFAQEDLVEKMREGSPSRQSVVHRLEQIRESTILQPWAKT